MTDPAHPALPPDVRASELRVNGQRVVILSYAIEPRALDRSSLTSAEANVADLAAQGCSNREIAERRGTSERTVANQMAAILRKLDVGSRRELAVRYVQAASSAEPDSW